MSDASSSTLSNASQRPWFDQVSNALQSFSSTFIPYAIDWRSALLDVEYHSDDRSLTVHYQLGFPAKTVIASLKQALETHLKADFTAAGSEVDRVNVSITSQIKRAEALNAIPAIASIKHIIAVASGKGGVGKSTVSVNLALALRQEGARVGLLDADIYGPSVQMMLGLDEDQRPELLGQQQWKPISVHGIEAMSMAFMITERTPMIWRGPMVSGALLQLLNNTVWPELDYLILDMPPGTGDIQLTAVQKVPISGAVIVTTPQEIALLDAKKGVEMFRRVGVPLLGIAENMAVHRCSKCGHEEHLFGEGGGRKVAELYETSLLGSLPLDLAIRAQADQGLPIVEADRESAVAEQYRAIARGLSASLWSQLANFRVPEIEVIDD